MLRLVHAFCEAAPMLLLQLYLLISRDTTQPPSKPFSDLNIVSVALSLFSVCWALASFSKNVRLQNVHRLVLTWLGVIFQVLSLEIFHFYFRNIYFLFIAVPLEARYSFSKSYLTYYIRISLRAMGVFGDW